MLFYEIKVNYQRQTGEDNPGAVRETYLVEGFNCADVESRLMECIKSQIFGDCEVPSCKKVQFYDLLTSPAMETFWYKVRVEMIILDEQSGKEKRKAVSVLVESTDVEEAVRQVRKHMEALDCEIVGVTKTPIMEVIRAIE